MKRIAAFFVVFFAAIILPIAVGAAIAVFGPAPYVLVGSGPSGSALGEEAYPDGSTVLVQRFDDHADATAAARALFDAIPASTMQRTFEVTRYRRSDDGRYGLLLPVGRFLVGIEAPDQPTLEARFAALDFVAPNPERNILWVGLTERPTAMLLLVTAYVLGLAVLMSRGGAWAGRLAAPEGVSPAPAGTLRARILGINGLDQPFRVFEEEGGRLYTEWRLLEPKWQPVLAAGGLRRANRIYLELDEDGRTVRALEKSYKIAWSGGVRGFSGRIAFFQSIALTAFEPEPAAGIGYQPGRGWTRRSDHQYCFVPAEMRAPLIAVVRASGWTWQPVMTFLRPVGG